MLLRRELIRDMVEESSGEFQEFRSSRVFRALLKRRQTGLLVSVVLARCYPTVKRGLRWIVEPPQKERKRVTVLALLDKTNASINEMRVFRMLPASRMAYHVGVNSEWLNAGAVLYRPADLLRIVCTVRSSS
jgi:uncharacterized MAPEG superfamily protein